MASIPKPSRSQVQVTVSRSASVRAMLAERSADRVYLQAQDRADSIKDLCERLRDVRERNHLGEMVHEALRRGEGNVSNV